MTRSLKPKHSLRHTCCSSILWQKNELPYGVRLSATPKVATLPPSLPRGLALQHLIGDFIVSAGLLDESFIFSRAEAAMFAKSDLLTVVPDDDEATIIAHKGT